MFYATEKFGKGFLNKPALFYKIATEARSINFSFPIVNGNISPNFDPKLFG